MFGGLGAGFMPSPTPGVLNKAIGLLGLLCGQAKSWFRCRAKVGSGHCWIGWRFHLEWQLLHMFLCWLHDRLGRGHATTGSTQGTPTGWVCHWRDRQGCIVNGSPWCAMSCEPRDQVTCWPSGSAILSFGCITSKAKYALCSTRLGVANVSVSVLGHFAELACLVLAEVHKLRSSSAWCPTRPTWWGRDRQG